METTINFHIYLFCIEPHEELVLHLHKIKTHINGRPPQWPVFRIRFREYGSGSDSVSDLKSNKFKFDLSIFFCKRYETHNDVFSL